MAYFQASIRYKAMKVFSLHSIYFSKVSMASSRSFISSRSFSTGPNNKRLYAILSRPVTWASLGIMSVVGGGILMFYATEKERKTRSGRTSYL